MENKIDVKLLFEMVGTREYEKTLLAIENQKLKEELDKHTKVEEKPKVE